MSHPTPPVLEDRYVIDPQQAAAASIDELVQGLLADAAESPVLSTGSADQVGASLSHPLPRHGVALQTALDELIGATGRYRRRNAHPGMFSYVASPGLPTDPLGHAMTAALNQNLTGFLGAPGASQVERTVVDWLRELTGLPVEADGLVVSGGSLANLSALAAAVYNALGPEVRERGLRAGPRPLIFATGDVHFSITRSAVMLGLGRDGVAKVPTAPDHRMDPLALDRLLAQAGQDGQSRACCVVATAGTTGLGTIDPLPEIAEVCRRHAVWLHVDAAYGGAALLSPVLRDRLRGIGEADSITVDLHKWCYLAFDASVLLYRDADKAREVFDFQADYALTERNQAAESRVFFDLSPEVSRRNRALPAYLAWRHYGLDLLGRNILHNVECAQYLADLVEAAPDFELPARPALSICCFRYRPAAMAGDQAGVDRLNTRILERLAEGGEFLLSPTLVEGRPVLRVCICTHTTRARHMEALLQQVAGIGQELGRTVA